MHDVSAQEGLCMWYCILFFFGTHYSVHESVCASVEDMYRVHNGTMASHFIKSHMGYAVCTMYNNIILDNSCGYMCMYLHVCAVKGGCTENQSYGNSERCQRYIVSFTQCVSVHKSVRVTVRSCLHTLFELRVVRNKRPNSLQDWYRS